jgi:hypothetical protein
MLRSNASGNPFFHKHRDRECLSRHDSFKARHGLYRSSLLRGRVFRFSLRSAARRRGWCLCALTIVIALYRSSAPINGDVGVLAVGEIMDALCI